MRKAYYWMVRLNREYSYASRILTSTDEIAEAMVYAIKWATEQSKLTDEELTVSSLECEGEILVPDGVLGLTGKGQ